MIKGGPTGLVRTFIATTMVIVSVVASLAEISSIFVFISEDTRTCSSAYFVEVPTTGVVYLRHHDFATERARKYLSYLAGHHNGMAS